MFGLTLRPGLRHRLASGLLVFFAVSTVLQAQKPGPPRSQGSPGYIAPQPVTVRVNVRDTQGTPLNAPAIVHLQSTVGNFNLRLPTRDGSSAEFTGVLPGQYEIEIRCVGYQTTTQELAVASMGAGVSVFVYIRPESDTTTASPPPTGVVMTPKLQAEIDKGLDAMHREQYEAAKIHFAKAVKIAPSNLDALFLLGTAELALRQTNLAREQFQAALKLNPGYEKALLAMGELQLQSGETAGAIATLEKAFDLNGASWRTHLLLASAYAKAGRLEDAEKHAGRAVTLAKEKGAYVTFLLGEVQEAEGKLNAAKSSWELVLSQYPNDPIAARAKDKLAQVAKRPAEVVESATTNLPPTLASRGDGNANCRADMGAA